MMDNKITVEVVDNDSVLLRGRIEALSSSRRANRLLRDLFNASFRNDQILLCHVEDVRSCFDKIQYLGKLCNLQVEFSNTSNKIIEEYIDEDRAFVNFSQKALSIRNNDCCLEDFVSFKNALIKYMPGRTLYDLQMLSAYHLAFSQNACNFSVPGAGKTSVVYGAYAYLKNLPEGNSKKVDYILIIGPLSSFGPWENEYKECFNKKATSKRLSGITVDEKRQYLYEKNIREITLIAYQSVSSVLEELKYFLRTHKVMVVLDEAHKIKNTSETSVYAKSVMELAPLCTARVILTGTPAPNGYEDLYNLFKFIWPTKNVINYRVSQLKDMSNLNHDGRVDNLINMISPYFIRVKKSDLHIPEAIVHPLIKVPMKDEQRRIYDYIENRYMKEISDSQDNLCRMFVVKARLIRLMQAATNPLLLKRPLKSFVEIESGDVKCIRDDDSVLSEILRFSDDFIPAKFEVVMELVKGILKAGGKVVIWACYIQNIQQLSQYLMTHDIYNKVLCGSTPVMSDDMCDDSAEYECTREAIVEEFNNMESGLNVIIANPLAVAESISLHKACHNAIYLERSFNASHFIQSKDRIHRYGLANGTKTNYYYLVSQDSIDETISDRLDFKEQRMMEIMEKMPIPLFNNVTDDGREDIKAVLKDYARRIKT